MFPEIGIKHIKNFLSVETTNNINSEIEEISNKYLINGVTRASTWINKHQYEISNPIVNINKVNLLEVAKDVHDQIVLATSKNYILSTFRIIIEKYNIHPIEWHTDHSPDTIRAIIYLKGGEKNNGNLSYIKGSHKEIHDKKIHKIDPREKNLLDKIESCETNKCDLIFFDINGFHKKNKVTSERRVLFLEFQEKNSNKEKMQIVLDNSKITPKVRENLDFLFFSNTKNTVPPIYSDHLPGYTPIKIFFYYIKIFLESYFKRFFRK